VSGSAQDLAEARVLPVFVFAVFGSLTFEVTCTRQRDALARQGIMSIARHAGQVWHAVARQVHRRVRLRFGATAQTPLGRQICPVLRTTAAVVLVPLVTLKVHV
jgi:hypothetical protein